MDRGRQQPVDEHQLVLRTSACGPLPLPGGETGLMAHVPQPADLSNESSDHIRRQAHDPPDTGDHCTSRVPHHMTVINNQGPDVSPPTRVR
jgi:hypothetical protein